MSSTHSEDTLQYKMKNWQEPSPYKLLNHVPSTLPTYSSDRFTCWVSAFHIRLCGIKNEALNREPPTTTVAPNPKAMMRESRRLYPPTTLLAKKLADDDGTVST